MIFEDTLKARFWIKEQREGAVIEGLHRTNTHVYLCPDGVIRSCTSKEFPSYEINKGEPNYVFFNTKFEAHLVLQAYRNNPIPLDINDGKRSLVWV